MMDVPTSDPALRQWNEQIAKGDLVVVGEAEAPAEPEMEAEASAEVEPDAEAPKQRRTRAPKAKPSDDTEE